MEVVESLKYKIARQCSPASRQLTDGILRISVPLCWCSPWRCEYYRDGRDHGLAKMTMVLNRRWEWPLYGFPNMLFNMWE
jgi:hypothetical protein